MLKLTLIGRGFLHSRKTILYKLGHIVTPAPVGLRKCEDDLIVCLQFELFEIAN